MKSEAPIVDLRNVDRIMGIGGGTAAHAIGALQRWPHLEAILLGRPSVYAAAQTAIARCALAHRIRTMACDIWKDPFPLAGAHFYSGLTPDECAPLARKSFEHLPADGVIAVHDSQGDVAAILREAGFRDVAVANTVVTGRKPRRGE